MFRTDNMFNNRNLCIKLKVTNGNGEEVEVFEGQVINLAQFVRSHEGNVDSKEE